MDERFSKASDPATPVEDLRHLAMDPQLRPLIARNPAAYPGLLDWMIEKNEPEVIAALRERQAAVEAGQLIPLPTVPLPDLPADSGAAPTPPPMTAVEDGETPTPEPESSDETDVEPEKQPEGTMEETEVAAAETAVETVTEDPETPAQEPTPQDATQIVTPAAFTPASPSTPDAIPAQAPLRKPILGNTADETTVLPPVVAPVPANNVNNLPPTYAPTTGPIPMLPVPNQGYNPAPNQYPPVTGPIPMGTPNPYEAQPQRKSNAGLWTIFVVLLLAVIGMITAIALITTGVISLPGEPSTTSSVDAGDDSKVTKDDSDKAKDKDQKDGEEEESSESPTPEAKETIAPAPADAQIQPDFTTETGDSTCQVSGDTLTCQVRNLVKPVAGCQPESSVVIEMSDGDPKVRCQMKTSYSASGPTITHDSSITYNDFACESTFEGTRCWNTVTGKGFFFAKQNYQQQDVAIP